jgi:hypothetical protein
MTRVDKEQAARILGNSFSGTPSMGLEGTVASKVQQHLAFDERSEKKQFEDVERQFTNATLQLAPDEHLAAVSTPWTWKTDFAMSRPIVVTACMSSSSESWEPLQRPHPWHSRAGGGAVHSIRNGHLRRGHVSSLLSRNCSALGGFQ